MDHLELSTIPGIIVSRVTNISGKDNKDTKFSGFFIKIVVDYRDVLGTKEISEMNEIPVFNYTVELVCYDTVYITVTLIPYLECNNSEKLTTCKKIKDETVVVNAINNSVNNY